MTELVDYNFQNEQDLVRANFEINRLTASQAIDVHELYKEYREEPYSISKISGILEALPSAGITYEGSLIGFCYLEFFAPDIVEIGSLFVQLEWRNKRLGEMLLKNVHKQIVTLGFKAAIVSNSILYPTKEPKIMARKFYERLGYNIVLSTDDTDVLVTSFS